MTIKPKSPKDLALAPTAAEIDANLGRLRDRTANEIERELQLELDRPAFDDSSAERAERVLAIALRDVDLHGWNAELTEDRSAIRLTGGSVTLDVALGEAVRTFIDRPHGA
jgi:hypothetical protein